MDDEKKKFYNELRKIQDYAIGVSLSKRNEYEHIDDMLEDITYDVIYRICEMIDGYRNDLIEYSLVNKRNGKVVNDGFSLHDWCEAYLRCTDN